MADWEFLLQQEGDRTWLPLESTEVEILEGRYRIVARSNRPNAPVEVRIVHVAIEENPPKRRVQKRANQTNAEGLMVVFPFTRLQPGLWELSCAGGDLMSELLGNGWQHTIRLQVLSKDAIASDDWEPDWSAVTAPEPASTPVAEVSAEVVAEAVLAEPDAIGAIAPKPTLPVVAVSEILEVSAAAPEPETNIPEVMPVLGPLGLTTCHLYLEEATYSLTEGQPLTLSGWVGVPRAELSEVNPETTWTGHLQILLRNPQSAEILVEIQEALELSCAEFPEILTANPDDYWAVCPFRCSLAVPPLPNIHLVTGEVAVYPSEALESPLAIEPFTVTAALEALLDQLDSLQTPPEAPSPAEPVAIAPALELDDPWLDEVELPAVEIPEPDLAEEPELAPPTPTKPRLKFKDWETPPTPAATQFQPSSGTVLPPQLKRPTIEPVLPPEPKAKSLDLPNFPRPQPTPPPMPEPLDALEEDLVDWDLVAEVAETEAVPAATPAVSLNLPTALIQELPDVWDEAEAIAAPEPTPATSAKVEEVEVWAENAEVAEESEEPSEMGVDTLVDPDVSFEDLTAAIAQADLPYPDALTLEADLGADLEADLDAVFPPETLELEPEPETDFQALRLQERFWTRLNALANDVEFAEALREEEEALSEPEVLDADLAIEPILESWETPTAIADPEVTYDLWADEEPEPPAAPPPPPAMPADPWIAAIPEVEDLWLAQEIVVDDEMPESPTLEPADTENLDSWDEEEPVPVPILQVPAGDWVAGRPITVRVKLPYQILRLCVKLWMSDRQTLSLMGEPLWLTNLTLNPDGEMEMLTEILVPLDVLELRLEAIAVEISTQRESHKITIERMVVPADLPATVSELWD